MMRLSCTVLLLALGSVPMATAGAQGTADRTANLWTASSPARGVVQLDFTHRFEMSGAPLRKITNTPAFHVATGLAQSLGVGFVYGSNSDLVSAYPNEWEWFARWSPVSEAAGGWLDARLQAGWNVAAESFDAELSTARRFGPVRLLVAGRAFHHAFYRDEARYALAGGAILRLTDRVAIGGDYGSLFDRRPDERPAWSAGLHLTIPYTPHTMSLHAANVGTGTLEGASRGTHTRWGFEYTVPIALRRFARRPAPVADSMSMAAATMSEAAMMPMTGAPDTVIVTISQLRFEPQRLEIHAGDVVVWKNADPLAHAVRVDSSGITSPLFDPGEQWSHRFIRPGSYTYHCTPHPFMKGEIVVKEKMQ